MKNKILSVFFLIPTLFIATEVLAPNWVLPVDFEIRLPDPLVEDAAIAFDLFIQQAIDAGSAPGAAVAIVNRGHILLQKGYGVQSVQNDEPIDAHTIFRIASLSKSFAGFLTGRMVEKGIVNWEDPLVQYLPDFCMQTDDQTRGLKLKHLLSHTTGLPYHTFTNMIETGWTTQEIMPFLYEVDLIGRPGQVYSYQNAVYSLIGEALQSATGLSYEENLEREIFGPLGMADASASLEGFKAHPKAAMPHAGGGGYWRQLAPSPNYYNAAPAGGVNASAADMAKYLLAMLGNRPDVLSKETLAKLGEPQVVTPVRYRYFTHWNNLKKASYGMGWRVLNLTDGGTLLYHGGFVNGYRAEIAVHPTEDWGICVMFNGASAVASQSVPTFMELLENARPAPQL